MGIIQGKEIIIRGNYFISWGLFQPSNIPGTSHVFDLGIFPRGIIPIGKNATGDRQKRGVEQQGHGFFL